MFRLYKIIISAIALGSIALTASGSDEPDLKRENRLHRIYQQYNLNPTDNSVWQGMVAGKTQDYSVQEGDTLWDLSETLFGDANFWPKIWSLNSEKIENPHEIFPGQSVLFTPGTTGEAPSLAVNASGEAVEGTEATETSEAKVDEIPLKDPVHLDLLSKAEIGPEKKSKPVPPVPRSLPHWTHGKPGALKFEVQKVPRNFPAPQEVLPYYLSENKIQGVGKIVETEMNTLAANEFQYVSVQLPEGASSKELTVVREVGNVKDTFRSRKGTIVQVQGQLEVMEPVNSEKNIYRAFVKKAVQPVEVGSTVIAGTLPTYNREEAEQGSGSARVIGGPVGANQKYFGTQNILYLGGEEMVVGQTYPIFKYNAQRNEDTHTVENPRQIGRVKVIQVANDFATAIVLESHEDIQVGDITDPQMLSQ